MRIGPIEIQHPLCQAGLAGYSDRAMRLVARRRGCPYAVTEALLDIILLNGGEGLRKSIDLNDEDHPIAGQIIGSEPHTMAAAARIIQQSGYDVLDLNFACPVKKIKNKARGGHMLKDTPRALAILRAVRDILPANFPITLSLRRGFDDTAEALDVFHEIVDEAWSLDIAAIRVHARTVEQKYVGASRWSFLKEVKQRHPTRTILGSGDLFTAEDVVRMLQETGVDAAWIARGAIGNPWIFKHAATLLAASAAPLSRYAGGGQGGGSFPTGGPPLLSPPTIAEQRDALQEHFTLAMELHGEQLAGRRMRKQGIKYSRFHPDAHAVKDAFIRVQSLRDWLAVLDHHYGADAPGVWPSPTAADEVNAPDLQSCEATA